MKKIFLFFTLILLIELNVSKSLRKIKLISCKTSNKTILMSSVKCFTKSHSRNITTLNAVADIARPVYNAMVSWVVEKSRRVLKFAYFRCILNCGTDRETNRLSPTASLIQPFQFVESQMEQIRIHWSNGLATRSLETFRKILCMLVPSRDDLRSTTWLSRWIQA